MFMFLQLLFLKSCILEHFYALPFKPSSVQYYGKYFRYINCFFFYNNSYMFSSSRNAQVTLVEKPQLKVIHFQNYNHWYIIRTWIDIAFKVPFFGHCHLMPYVCKVTWNYAYTWFLKIAVSFLLTHVFIFRTYASLDFRLYF